MEKFIDYYKVLNVSYYATFEEIKDSYRIRVKETHPDSPFGDSENFKMVKEAYDVLSNEEKRKRYNEFLFNYTKVNTPVNNHNTSKEPPYTVKNKPLRTQRNWKLLTISSLMLNSVLIMVIIWSYNQGLEEKNKIEIVQEKLEKSKQSFDELQGEYEDLNDQYTTLEVDYNNLLTQPEYTYEDEPLGEEAATMEPVAEEPEFINPEGAFTQGSSKEHVKKIMGTPTSLSKRPLGGETWWYGGSAYVDISSEGIVEGWYDYSGGKLKVQ
jgi:curved DNA-binding protein CbpA